MTTKKSTRVTVNKMEREILLGAVDTAIMFAKSLQFATVLSFFINLIKTKSSILVGLSRPTVEHFTQNETISSPASRFLSKSLAYQQASTTFLTGDGLKQECINVFGKRVFQHLGQTADVKAVREALMAKKCKLSSSAIFDNLHTKNSRIKNSDKLMKIAAATGIIDPVKVWPNRSEIDPLELIGAISIAADQQNVFAIDIRGYTKIMEPLDMWIKLLDAIGNKCIFVAGFGEDEGVLTATHLQILRDRIESGHLSIRRWFIEVTPPSRRIMLLGLNLVGPPKPRGVAARTAAAAAPPAADRKFTVFTYAKRTDKLLWNSLDEERRKEQPRLAWLFAPKKVWNKDVVRKAALQNTVTTYDAAQHFINNNNN